MTCIRPPSQTKPDIFALSWELVIKTVNILEEKYSEFKIKKAKGNNIKSDIKVNNVNLFKYLVVENNFFIGSIFREIKTINNEIVKLTRCRPLVSINKQIAPIYF